MIVQNHSGSQRVGERFAQVQSVGALLRYLNVYAAQYFRSATLQRGYVFFFFLSTSIIWHFMKQIQLKTQHKKKLVGVLVRHPTLQINHIPPQTTQNL